MTKTGECAIRMRISVNGTRIDSNTGKYIDPTLWNQSKERAKGTSKNAIDLNDYIDETNIKLFKLFQDMQSEGVCIYSLKSGPVSHSKMGHPRERTKLIK